MYTSQYNLTFQNSMVFPKTVIPPPQVCRTPGPFDLTPCKSVLVGPVRPVPYLAVEVKRKNIESNAFLFDSIV